MKRILTAIVLIPLVLLAVFRAPLWLFTSVCGLVALFAADEYLRIARLFEANVSRILGLATVTALFVVLPFIVFAFGDSRLRSALGWVFFFFFLIFLVGLLLLYPLLSLVASMRDRDLKTSLPASALGAFVVPYVVVPLLSLVVIRFQDYGWFYVLWLFVMVWSGDIFAYYVGKNFGKRLLAPQISPKKTWEGTIASVISSAALSGLLCYWAAPLAALLASGRLLLERSQAPEISPVMAIGVAVIVNVAAQLGDLAESALKRGAGIKDSGSLLPGHGGVLDRIDALLFAAPTLLIFLMIRGLARTPTY